jgi:radical SAM protein with 4Fe4S-binding SPASM domain
MTAHPPTPRELQVEVTGACNLRCRMCLVRYRPPLGRVEGSLPFETFARLIDALPGLQRITLQGLGEPLLAPDLFRMVEYAAERGIRIGFNTNGTLLRRSDAERLVTAGLDWLHVSLDGARAETYEGIRDGATFARVADNVRGLVTTMHRLGAARPTLSLVMVAMRRNVREVPDLVRLAAAWGIGRVWVQNLSHSFSDTEPEGAYRAIRDFTAAEALWDGGSTAVDVDRIFAEARVLARDLGVSLRLPRIEPPSDRRAPGTPGCDWPWRSAYVRHDGRVQPCCMLMGEDRAIVGDLGETDFATVWSRPVYAEFRARLLGDDPPDPCRGCSMYRGVF